MSNIFPENIIHPKLFMNLWTESDKEHGLVSDALRLVKELITAVDNKVNQQEKKQRLKEVYRYSVVSVMEFAYSWISWSRGSSEQFIPPDSPLPAHS